MQYDPVSKKQTKECQLWMVAHNSLIPYMEVCPYPILPPQAHNWENVHEI